MDLIKIQKYMENQEYEKAQNLLDELLKMPQNLQVVQVLRLERVKCLYGKGEFKDVLNDCNEILKAPQTTERQNQHYECRARIFIIETLLTLNRPKDVEMVAQDWINSIKDWIEPSEDRQILIDFIELYLSATPTQSVKKWLHNFETKVFAYLNKCAVRNFALSAVRCIYCNLSFLTDFELKEHCKTQEHMTMVMSDEGRQWLWRAPPRGYKPDMYKICKQFEESGNCRFGAQCIEAHGEEELAEWEERYQYRRIRMQRAIDKELYGKSYTEQLLEKWGQSTNPSTVLKDKIDDIIEETCSSPYSTFVTSKNDNHQWIFSIKTRKALKAVALLQDTYRCHFHIGSIAANGQIVDLKNNQEYLDISQLNLISGPIIQYDIIIIFQTNIYGTFRQSVVFDFGSEPGLVKHLCVDVVPTCNLDKINEIRREFIVSIAERWTNVNSTIIPFIAAGIDDHSEWEKYLKATYPCPDLRTFQLSSDTVSGRKLNRNNYKEIMHELLYIEEIERYNLISKYNLTTKLRLAHSYLLSPNITASNTTKYSNSGELFAPIHLGKELSEDTPGGRLILMHCQTVYLYPLGCESDKIYEALVEDKGKDTIYLRLSSVMVEELQLTTDTDLTVQIQFQINRVPYGEWHYAIDKITNVKLLFPDTYVSPNIPWSPSRQWSATLDRRLNVKQTEAILAITTPLEVKLPPILINGPYGTGKTFTLAHAIKELIRDDKNKVLLCTHSNSAADLYIKDYLDAWVEKGNENARPLRIYYKKRWVSTVSSVVLKYCCISSNGNVREFYLPTAEEIAKHKIIVVTLSTSVYLSSLGLPLDTFTHILVDEAAQALECEMITPLGLATENTRIVLAGDHMQLGPHVFSKFAKDRNLHISLLERLYDYYPSTFSCKVSLSTNYRAHEDILRFISESFYEHQLKSSSKQKAHPNFYPITFFTTRGEDIQCKNSTGFYNNSEVYEVVERVVELKENWPDVWGPMNEQSIGVVTPYYDQVFRIRSELRKRKIDVCVERVLNVQGKQFRAIILSTVRTRNTCLDKSEDELDYGFLSDVKLLNTAITRAQSLVAVVGDPIALSTVGRCSKIWESFLNICYTKKSLHGMKWIELRSHVDAIELKKTYGLNPLAPEFVPRRKIQSVPLYIPGVQNIVPNPPPIPVQILKRSPEAPPVHLYRPIQPPQAFPIPQMPPTIPLQRVLHPIKPLQLIETQMLNDCIQLLPQNMTLVEMMLQPLDFQQYWYNYLRNTVGLQLADKFLFLLRSLSQKGTHIPQSNVIANNPIIGNTPIDVSNAPTLENSKSNPLYNRRSTHTSEEKSMLLETQCDDEKHFNQKINEYFAGLALDLGIDRPT